jgi:glutathione peroxidase|tara:strand:+ start:4273 stop:4848 length:576 start_codon:yes stop_codon:yes gene_type:complete
MKYLLFSIALLACGNEPIQMTQSSNSKDTMESTDFYSLQASTIDGADFSFEQLKGKRVLIVNVASKCGYTPQYEQLQKLHEQYGGKDFVVLGFPANDFGFQEPGSAADIKSFCSKNYGVTFQMMAKVKTNKNKGHEVYQWLCNKSQNGIDDAKVSWNFNKFMIDENGQWIAHYDSRMNPLSTEITNFAAGK